MAINNQVDTKLKLKAVREYVEGNGSLRACLKNRND